MSAPQENIRGNELEVPRYLPEFFWMGKDIDALDTVVIQPGKTAFVPVDLTTLTIMSEQLAGWQLAQMEAHTRSRYMQMGIEVHENASQRIKAALDAHQTQAEVLVQNHFPSEFTLRPGGLFQPFLLGKSRVTGEELVELHESGDLTIRGEEGSDWNWRYKECTRKSPHDIVGIDFALKDERFWLPKGAATIDPYARDYRKQIDAQLEQVPNGEIPNIWIGETRASLLLNPKVHGVIRDRNHFNSPLIKGGQTNWNVRVEMRGDPSQVKKVSFDFARPAPRSLKQL